MIYLATPYSHPYAATRQERFEFAELLVHTLLPLPVFSPVVYFHALAERYKLPTDAEYWAKLNTHFLRQSEALYFAKIFGWKGSKGMLAEKHLAIYLRIPIVYIDINGQPI